MSKRSLKDGSNQPKSAYRIPRTNQVRQHLLEDLEDRLVLAGTPVLIEINPSGDSDPAEFVQLGDLTFFSAEDATSGRELLVTDGTDTGTRLVRDINVGSDHANPESLIAYNNRLYFSADDGINGRELWSTDGTSAGTMMVADIYPGEG
ncbi:MAG: hypothetical protein KDA87_14905, partial [Planctomycetales bacterium]|nr:hypothetical protein [Planctomycetales bacterium]